MTIPTPERAPRRSLFSLIGSLPTLLVDLVKAELEQLKAEIAEKLKMAGVGIGLLIGGALFGFFAFAVLITAAILGIAVALPAWLAALIVAAALIIITVILMLAGAAQLKKGTPPAPTKTIKSIQRDVDVIRGTGKRGTP